MRTKSRSVGLDFLKAVAAACIVLHHFQQMSGATFSGVNFFILPDLFRTEYVFGWLTILFFMISGYLTSRQEQRTATPRRVPAQIWHKCLRLYPMAVLACLVYVALGFAHRALLGAWYWPLGGGGLWTVFNSLLVSYTNGTVALPGTAANNVTWYLSVLLNCYLIFYIIVWLGRRTRVGWHWLCLFFFALACSLKSFDIALPLLSVQPGLCEGYIPFFLGVVLAKAAPYIPRKVKYASLLLPALCLFVIFGDFPAEWVENQWWMQAFMIYPPLVLVAATIKGSAENPLVRGITFLGQTSFDVYLWHCPLFSLCRLAEGLLDVRLTVTRGKMLLFLLAVEALGALLLLFVEKPLARMTKRFEWDKLKIVDPA